MSQAETLLLTLDETVVKHSHPMKDSDSYFVIDPATRTMSNGSDENIIMQYDHDSEIYTFELPRYIDGHDMTFCNRVIVHWDNINSNGYTETAESTEIDSPRINPYDASTVICAWTISRNVTQHVGALSFLVQFKCVEDGVTTYEWHTDVYSNVRIKASRNNGEESVIEYTDIIEQWRQKLFGAGDTVEASIQAKSEEEQENIASKGATVLATIPEDYTTTYNMANNAVRTRANAIVETVAGTTIVATDCSDDYVRGARMFGKSTQVQTTGAQLLDFDPYISDLSATAAYCHVSVNANPFASAGTYYYSCSGTFGTSYKLWAYDSGDNLLINTGTGVVEVTEEQAANITKVSIVIQGVTSGATYTGYIYPMVNIGTSALPWEPYSGGTIAPNPDWPQEITAIASPTITVAGANLLENTYQTTTKNGVTITSPGDGSLVFSGTATTSFGVQVNAELRLPDGMCFLSGAASGLLLTIWGQTSSGWKSIAIDNGNGVSFEANSDIYPCYLVQYSVEENRTYDVTVYPMVNVGTSALSWGTYKKTQTFTSPDITFWGIPVDSDGSYTDENGQQWICDEIDFERGVFIQRVRKCVISGAPNFQETSNWPGRFIWNCLPSDLANGLCACCCNFAYWSEWGMNNNKDGRDYGSASGANLYYTPATTMSADEVNAKFAAMIASDTPPVIVAQRTAPIETALNDAALLLFSQLHSNYPTTTVLNDRGMHMELSYNADTKTYLEQLPKVSDEQAQTAVDAWLTENLIAAEGVSY